MSTRTFAALAVLVAALAPRPAAADFLSDVALRVHLGFRLFNDDSALGNKPSGGTALSPSAVLGIRAEYELTRFLALEGEIPASVTDSRDDLARVIHFDPRLHVRLSAPRLSNGRVLLALTAGGGVPIVLSDNQTGLESDVLGEFYGGVALALEPRLGSLAVRFDARLHALPARGDQLFTPEFEFLATVYRAEPDRWRKIQLKRMKRVQGPPPPPDSDNDGIADKDDKCPKRPEDVDKFEDDDGCPDIDNDLDRVLDIADKCPIEREVLNGFEDEDGCADTLPQDLLDVEGVIGVRFASSTANFTTASLAILKNAALVLSKYPTVRLEIGGHTDNQGDEGANQSLSQTRANAVADYIATQGVSRDRLVPVGYGPFAPIAENETPAGRNQNRRVEFKVIRPQELKNKP